jgi:hypothetical protein
MHPTHFLAISVLGTVLAGTCALCDAITNSCEIAAAEVLATTFGSEVEAAHALSERYRKLSASQDVEYVGAVYALSDGRFGATVGRSCAAHDGFRFAVPRMPRATPVALWHTHGTGGLSRRYFSAVDAATVRRTGLPFYLATADGGLHVLDRVTANKPLARLPGSALRIRHGAFRGRPVAFLDR